MLYILFNGLNSLEQFEQTDSPENSIIGARLKPLTSTMSSPYGHYGLLRSSNLTILLIRFKVTYRNCLIQPIQD